MPVTQHYGKFLHCVYLNVRMMVSGMKIAFASLIKVYICSKLARLTLHLNTENVIKIPRSTEYKLICLRLNVGYLICLIKRRT